MPCINLGNGVYHSLPEEKTKLRPFASPKGQIASASFGSWLLYDEHMGSGQCFLRAPNSVDIKVPCLYLRRSLIVDSRTRSNNVDIGADAKIVVCSSRLVVTIFRRHIFSALISGVLRYSNIACFRPSQQLPATWSSIFSSENHRASDRYMDIALYHGKIFAIARSEELFCYEFFGNDGENRQQKHGPLIKHATDEGSACSTKFYLVISSDKKTLLMVRWNRRITNGNCPAKELQVFEVDFDEHRWAEVKDFGGQVLFLSRNSSKAFKAGLLEHFNHTFRHGNYVGGVMEEPRRLRKTYSRLLRV